MGHLVIVSGFPATGTGKTTVVAKALLLLHNAARVVTCTTRPMRPNEKDGCDYHFLSQKTFQDELDAGNFLEYDQHYAHWYGTRKSDILQTLAMRDVAILTTDLTGANTFRRLWEGGRFIAITASTKNASCFMKGRGDSLEKITKRLTQVQLRKEKKVFTQVGFDLAIENVPGMLDAVVTQFVTFIRENSA